MYDLIIEMIHTLWKNGFSLTALGTAVYVLLKQRKVKKRLRRFIPWLLDDESEIKAYIHNQHLIMERLGIPFAPTLEIGSKASAKKKRWLLSRQLMELSAAQHAEPYTNSRRKILMKKLKSRKFIIAVVGAILIIANDGLDLGINSETVLAFAGLLATWIVGEAAVDAKRAGAADKTSEDGTNQYH